MSAHDQNLKVLTDHVLELAAKQQAVAGRVKLAGEAVPDGLTGRIVQTHGVACAATSLAVSGAETARHAACERQYKVSASLAEHLQWAAHNYSDVDFQAGGTIGACAV